MLFNACVWFICRIHVQKWWEHLGLNSESHCSSAVGFFPRSLVASQHAPVSDVLPFLSPVVAAAVAAEIRPCEFPRAGIANVAVFVGAIENFADFVPADKLDGRGNENPKIIIRYYSPWWARRPRHLAQSQRIDKNTLTLLSMQNQNAMRLLMISKENSKKCAGTSPTISPSSVLPMQLYTAS